MIKLETEMTELSAGKRRASVHLDLGEGGFTISNILLQKTSNSKIKITLPLMQIADNKRPAVTLQGKLKEVIFEALCNDYESKNSSRSTRLYDEDYALKAWPDICEQKQR